MTLMLLDCSTASWFPIIGDPDAIGWITVASYAGVAILALRVFLRAKFMYGPNDTRRNMIFWFLLFIFLVFLGLNKQLDLQSYITAVGRCVAKSDGWYGDRRDIQLWFIRSVAGGFVFSGVFTVWYLRASLSRNIWAISGIAVLLVYILERAALFYHFSSRNNMEVNGITLNSAVELFGVFLIGVQAVINVRKGGPYKATS